MTQIPFLWHLTLLHMRQLRDTMDVDHLINYYHFGSLKTAFIQGVHMLSDRVNIFYKQIPTYQGGVKCLAVHMYQ